MQSGCLIVSRAINNPLWCGVSSVKSLIKPNPHVTELIIDIVFIRVKENPLNQKADLTIKTPNLLNCNT